MPIRSPRWPCRASLIEEAPDEWGGVFALWEGEQLLHIGHAPDCGPTLKAALKEHLTGRCSACSGKATHYGWELALEPLKRSRELLEEFRAAHGRLPPCNEQEQAQAGEKNAPGRRQSPR